MEVDKPVYATGRAEWREWLKKNHDKEDHAWLVTYKKHTGRTSVSYNDAVEEAICFGWIDGQMKSIDKEKYANRFSPRTGKSRWSQTNKAKAEKLIEEGRMTPAGLAKIEQAKKSGAWDNAYFTNQGTEEMPADLEQALSENVGARENFQRFPRSYHNACILYVNDAKTTPTRQKRIADIVMRSALNKKLGDTLT